MKVLVATEKPFAKVAVDGIREVVEGAGYELALLEKYTDKAQLLEAVEDADALIIRSDIVDAAVLDAAKRLKIVVRAGAGYDNIDLEAATAHNVVAMNTPGQNSNALQLFQLPQACENFRAHIDLGLLLRGFCFSCHVSSSNQNSTRSRTNATWDFSNVTVSFPTSRVTLPSS